MARCPVCHRRVAETAPCPRDGRVPPISSTLERSLKLDEEPTLPGYIVGMPLGAGGFSTVWEATRASDGLKVALKVGRGEDPLAKTRFQRDAEALERVGPPFVPQLYELGQLPDGRAFIAMKLLQGETLAAMLAKLPEPPGAAFAAAIGGLVLDALAAVHQKGVIHRDLKPENIVIAEDQRVCTLIDFGLMRRAEPESAVVTRRGTIVGTPEYMAPEQLRGEELQDARTDIYAFGVILYELLTLRLPFVGERSAIEHGHLALRPPRMRELAAVPEPLEKLTLACLAKERERRPGDAAALRLALTWAASTPLSRRDPASLAWSSPANSAPPPTGGAATDRAALIRSARPSTSPPGPIPPPRASLLTDGRQLTAVLLIEAGAASVEAMATVASRKGFVARQRGGRLVSVFSGIDTDDPLRAALAVARELDERRMMRVALHLTPLAVRRKEQGPPAVYGAPVEQPDAWLPKGAWAGVVLTAEAARALPEGEASSATIDAALSRPNGPQFYRLAGPAHGLPAARAVPLLGRGAVISALAESIEASMLRASTGLFTLLGEHGLGKSRLAGEAATLARCVRQRAQVIMIRAAQPLSGTTSQTSRELLARLLDVTAGTPPDPRALCIDKLGEEVGAETWRTVAATLGWITIDAAGTEPWAIRQGTMRAIAEGLRRRAREGPVAIIVDNAHWADDAALDALEYATLGTPDCPLWVLVTAHLRFEDMRRTWGSRAERHDRVVLDPLSEAAGMQLAAELLLPAEYPPEATLRQLARWSGGNPFCLAEIIRALKRAGIVRRRPSGSFYVATAELDQLPPLPAWQWLAARKLDALTPELAACVRLCSVLGPDFAREEVEQIQDAIEEEGGAGTPIDAGVGLRALADAGVLVRTAPELYAFQSPMLRDAVYESLAMTQRQNIHRHAFAWWRERVAGGGVGRRGLEHIAWHAGACGDREQAAAAYLALGDIAQATYQNVVADQRYTSALSFLDEADARRRAVALAGRGKVRYRVHRIREALEDLAVARALARQIGDDRLTAVLLLEEATALDHATDFAESLRRVEEARPIVATLGDPKLDARLLMARGRSTWRQHRVAEAADLLGRAADAAKAVGDREARAIALLLHSIALVIAGKLAEAEARFFEVIALCSEVNDRLHLCSAYANRAYLWAARSAPERGMEDLRRAVELAREIGNPEPEHVATHNLAELLHWCGREEDALALARRSRVLEERFAERAAPDDSLLLARIEAARGSFSEAAKLAGWIAEHCPPSGDATTVRVLFRMLKLVLAARGLEVQGEDGEDDTWDAVVADAERSLPVEELLEVLFFRAREALEEERVGEAREALAKAKEKLDECRMWRPRFEELSARADATLVEALAAAELS